MNAVAFADESHQVIAGLWNGLVKVFNAEDGVLMSTMRGHERSVSALSVSPQGLHIVTGSLDRSLLLWDAQAGKPIATLSKHRQPVTSVAYSHDGTHLLSSAEDGAVKVWRATLGLEKAILEDPNKTALLCVAFNPKTDTQLFTGGADCALTMWDLRTKEGKRYEGGHARPIVAIDVSLDGTEIVTGSEDGTCVVWDAATGEKKLTFTQHHGPVNTVAYGRRVFLSVE